MTSAVTLPDGAKLAYDVYGTEHAARAKPIVLVGGMGSTRVDWERLSNTLSKNRPVLVFDHRGMGQSSYSTAEKNDDITTESMARDLVFLIYSLGWKEVAICGFSMGGVVTQELILLPYHPYKPTPLPFRVTHIFLTGTLATPLRDKRYGLPIAGFKRTPGAPKLTLEEEMDLSRPLVEASFDPAWVKEHPARAEEWVKHMVVGREEIAQLIPHARFVEVGSQPGQIPDLRFGHHWWEYFDERVWRDVVDVFIGGSTKARL
ncbi:hypothetical protein HWV62_34713 [Athelia sp. TMB]|nr:hypothetical protein HWV62_34713 [Athelia sp. TMB]